MTKELAVVPATHCTQCSLLYDIPWSTLILSEQRNKGPDQESCEKGSEKGNNQCFWNLALILSFRLGLPFFKSEESAAPTS